MYFNKILSTFKRLAVPAPTEPGPQPKTEPEPLPEPTSGPAPGQLSIPYPEEAPDYSRTIENTDLDAVLNEWEVKYNVPIEEREYWKTKIEIKLDVTIPYPAGTYEANGIRHLTIRPEWVNPGVIAHEQAHNSYALLTSEQKAEFSATYTPIKTSDPLVVFLFSKNSYGLTNDIEGHAEIYRYLGAEMPQALKKYYPKLF
jgi:hypothetical protein